MKYLCLIYNQERNLAGLSPAEWDSLKEEYFAFTDGIRASGHHLGGNSLQATREARTLRVRDGTVSATDGPFAETTEQLGGYYLIEARDLNDAIQVASRIPSARMGSIEVRPIMEFNP
ncbi:MAG TPA: YciI family protein [Vicinamibacterales bacterium]|nr:YciI family protein [Vicinamibacterales bacterium]